MRAPMGWRGLFMLLRSFGGGSLGSVLKGLPLADVVSVTLQRLYWKSLREGEEAGGC